MITQFDEWLRQLAAAQKGPVTFPGASRGRKYVTTVSLPGDWTGATMRAQARLRPDAAGDPIATFAVTGPVVAAGVSTFTLTLTAGAAAGSTGAFPADSDLDGVEQFAVDVLLTSGGVEELLFGGVLPLLGRITA
jgi:hypothetical protein